MAARSSTGRRLASLRPGMRARPSAAIGNRVELVTACGRDSRPQGGMRALRDVMQRLRGSILRCTIKLDAAIVKERPPGACWSLPPAMLETAADGLATNGSENSSAI